MAIGNLFRGKQLMERIPLHHPLPLLHQDEGYGVIWSEKSACTSTLIWFLARTGRIHEARAFHSWPHRYRQHVLESGKQYRRALRTCDPRKINWIRVIRDPFKRAVSSYRHVLRHGIDRPLIETHLALSLEDGLSFEEFLDFLSTRDLTKSNPHYCLQRHPLEGEIKPRMVINADCADLLEGFGAFEELLGLSPIAAGDAAAMRAWAKEIASHHHAKRTGNCEYSARRKFTSRETSAEWPDYPLFLNEKTRMKISKLYLSDINLYGVHI